MGVLSNLFSQKKITSVVLIDIGATSVAGACALFTEGEVPRIVFSRRLPIETQTNEAPKKAMLRALTVLTASLIADGAPSMRRTVGNGSVDSIYVSIDAPWEETELRTIHLEQDESFVFTKALVKAALEHDRKEERVDIALEEHVVGTTLNGYATTSPFGRSAHRASLLVLCSSIDRIVMDEVTELLRSAYHTTHVTSISGTSLRLQTLRRIFPHEKEALVIDANPSTTSLGFVRGGLPVALATVPATAWIENVRTELEAFAQMFPLPRTVLLLGRGVDSATLLNELTSLAKGKLWLSDTPAKIIPILANQCSALVRNVSLTPPDISLILIAHYWGSTPHKEG